MSRHFRLLVTASAVGVSLALAGCTSDAPPSTSATSPTDAPVLQPGRPGEPNESLTGTDAIATPSQSHNAADVTFLNDMIVHHAQAIVMSDIVEGRLSDDEVTRIASRIHDEQDPEMQGMAQTLESWGEDVPPQAENPTFGMRDHGSHSSMPGMATQEQLDELGEAEGTDLDVLYLDLMIAHHQGALEMCSVVSREGSDERTEELSDDIVVSQQKQIDQMSEMRDRLRG